MKNLEEKEYNSYKVGFLTPTADLKERRDGWSPAVSGEDDPLLNTEYEARFSAAGNPICKYIIRRRNSEEKQDKDK